ncbi:E3 ubiquitin-protein ligase Siah2 isoform X2 [Anguilla rostrata]|uniref:E3 ubiquitin-protein ligase Siah2 isoform X2 n=1 Tax=Anguilla anguilla TaxID=7936 RepID=UPI0015AAA7F2|nr:E3 ubiquitin-protein ligase Siah2 isoform X2 [Anguilla anguilla]
MAPPAGHFWVMLCPASCLPLLRELSQWRCLLGWPRPHRVSGTRPICRATPLPGRGSAPSFREYASAGCLLSLHHSEKPEHEEVCEFRPYSCPCPGASCKWQGSLEAVMPHLMHAHKSITTLQGEDIVFLATDIDLPGAVDWVMMQSCFGFHFMLVLEKQEKYEGHQQFFAIVLLIGTRKQAENFAYRLELNGNRRRLTWEATPRSIHDGVAAAIMNSDCLVFDTSIAHLFADNGNLGINVTISMC